MSERALFAWRGAGFLFALFMMLPLLLVVLFAFTSRSLTNFPIEGLSLRWWAAILAEPQFPGALRRSLTVAAVAGLASAVLGTMAATGLAAIPRRRAAVIMSLLCLPLMMPALVVAVSLVTFFVSAGIKLSLMTVIVSHLLLTQPFVTLVVYAQLSGFDRRIVESARDLGATPWQAFRTVTLPVLQPTIVGAALIAAAISLDDFVVTFFTLGGGNTLPTLVWAMLRTSVTPAVNAIGTMLLMLTIVATLIGLWLTRYRG
jgi:ABC-type spermidine/putrescine transport system permease subunit II